MKDDFKKINDIYTSLKARVNNSKWRSKALVPMFVSSVVFALMFAASYIWGINFCSDMKELLALSLPWCCLCIISAAGFCAAYALYVRLQFA